MVGTDKSTELWCRPHLTVQIDVHVLPTSWYVKIYSFMIYSGFSRRKIFFTAIVPEAEVVVVVRD